MSIETGGPAFPTDTERQIGNGTWHYEGMTLRDYFAAMAMQGMLATGSHGKTAIAELAYQQADEMLKARGQG